MGKQNLSYHQTFRQHCFRRRLACTSSKSIRANLQQVTGWLWQHGRELLLFCLKLRLQMCLTNMCSTIRLVWFILQVLLQQFTECVWLEGFRLHLCREYLRMRLCSSRMHFDNSWLQKLRSKLRSSWLQMPMYWTNLSFWIHLVWFILQVLLQQVTDCVWWHGFRLHLCPEYLRVLESRASMHFDPS